MKDSRIGKIPVHWKTTRMKYLFTNGKGLSITKEDLVETGLPVISYGQIHAKDNSGTDINRNLLRYVDPHYQVSCPQCEVFQHDFVFADTSEDYDGCGNCVYKRDASRLFAGYHTIIMHSLYKADNRYYAYLFKTDRWRKQLKEAVSGVKVFSITQKVLMNSLLIIPPEHERKVIADFLDAKCAEIDILTSDIQNQVDTLEQYKRSVITETVTKGLDPDVEMKDSGIQWVGAIPAHWSIHPLYSYFGERKNKNRLGKENNLLSLSYGRVIRKDINTSDGLLPESFDTYNIVEAGDIIIRPTDLQNDKRSLRTGLVKEHGMITSAYIDLCPIKRVDSRYFHFLLHAYDVMKVFYNMGNGVRQGLNYSEFSRLVVFEPPYDEQVAMADYLEAKVTEMDAIIEQKKEQMAVLDTYKRSLIFEYVTGKKEAPLL